MDIFGFVDIEIIDLVLDNIDLVLFDLKYMVEEKFIDLIGVGMDKVLKFVRYLELRNIFVWIRYVLVFGIIDDIDNLEKLG